MLILFGILFGVICLETLLLVFVLWKTPAFTFLMAAVLKKPLLYIIGKDRMGYFKSFSSQNGTAKLGRDGLFHLTENSHTLEAGSKTPIYFAFRDLSATLLPEYPAIIQELREKGIAVNNVEDIKKYLKEIKQGISEDLPISVKSYKTYKLHDLENMFPFNLDPTFIDATVQGEIAKGLKMMQSAPMMIGTIVVLLIVAAIAVYIINMSFGGQVDPATCSAIATEAVRAACGGAAQQITNIPIGG